VLAAHGDDFRTCALRPHLIWGPGDTHLVPRLLRRARAGRLRRVGDGANLVDVTYVENAADAHLKAADALYGANRQEPNPGSSQNSPGGKAYFISQGEPVNCWEWINQILALANLPPIEKTISVKTASRFGRVLEAVYGILGIGSDPPMTRFLAAQLSTSHWFDISAARRDFGYEPRIPVADGMRRLGEWLSIAGLREAVATNETVSAAQ